METVIDLLIEKLRNDSRVVGSSYIRELKSLPSFTDGFHQLLLVFTNEHSMHNHITHYIKDNERIQERWVNVQMLEKNLQHEDYHSVILWLLRGDILLDPQLYLTGLKQRIIGFPDEKKEHQLLVEFSLFLRKYLQSKEYILNDHVLDAFNRILEALHHWARIVIIEDGIHPEFTVWEQVYSINPGVFKLYEELTTSKETAKQRVQLVLLACEFSVMSKMERCCAPVLRILGSRKEAWGIDELLAVSELQDIKRNLPLLLNKLVRKSLIKEMYLSQDDEFSILELKYTVK